MNFIQSLRSWWQARTGEEDTPFDGDMPAWVASMFVHMGIIIALSLLTVYAQKKSTYMEVTSSAPAQEEDLSESMPEEFYFSPEPEEKIGANSIGGTDAAFAMAPNISDVSVVPTSTATFTGEVSDALSAEGTLHVDPKTQSFGQAQEQVLLATGPHFSKNIAVKGAAGVGTTGAVGAIDRITHEILLSLEERKTLVVWLFDQSGSLELQRAQINKRFDRIYEELGVIEASGNSAFKKHKDKPLLSSVVSFGERVSLVTSVPTDNVNDIKSAVDSIKTDNSGVERTFSAVLQAVDKYKTFRTQEPRRNVMIVIFSDEVGDDETDLDRTVAACRKFEMPVYVVGVPAPFGRTEAMIKYVNHDPKYQQGEQWVPVRQGPESYRPEYVKMNFIGGADEPLDSGFGPYSLTRLCYETGGIYFAVHPNRNAKRSVKESEISELSAQLTNFFDPEIMRNYRPDYVSIKEYEKLISQNKARWALVQAAQMSTVTPMEKPQTYFPKVSEADLANRLSKAQQTAAVLEPKIGQLYETLKQGEKDREKITQPRWQAGYDLAMGRVLANKVRTESYNAMLAKAKQGMKFKDAKNDTWVLKPANEISVGSTLEKQAEQAKMYLERVVKDHENTPWAMLASKELKDPFGWQWEEKYTGVMAPKEGVGNAAAAPAPADDKKRMLEKPKPKAPQPKL